MLWIIDCALKAGPGSHLAGASLRRSGELDRLRFGSESPIAHLAVVEVPAHRVARRRGMAAGDRVADRDVLELEGFEIGALPFGPVRRDADALPRDDEAAEIFEKMRELRIAGRGSDRAMEGEIRLDRRLAPHHAPAA